MEDFYELIYKDFKNYIQSNSDRNPKVYKISPQKPPQFPVVEFRMTTNRVDNGNSSIDKYKLEYYSFVAFRITILTQNVGNIDKSIIANELSKLVNKYFMEYGLLKTNQEDAPNADVTVLRRIIDYECKVGNKHYDIRII